MTAIDIANAEQRAASDPRVSAFVAASAGSGKTKLLTDRLLRLMLGGTAPDKILCLTYTKAAAAEMRIRLNKRLGEWVVMDEPSLHAALHGLDVLANEKTIALARKLFADVLDLPGGMRIETIHAFCQSLLRRFPLEAKLSPHFEVADDDSAALRLREAREAALAKPEARDAVHILAAETDEKSFADITRDFCNEAAEFLRQHTPGAIATMQRAAIGAGEESAEEIFAAAVLLPREAELRTALLAIAQDGNASGQKFAYKLLDWLAKPAEERIRFWDDWIDGNCTAKGEPRSLRGFCGKKLAASEDSLKDEIGKECERILAVQEKLKAARLAALNAAAIALLAPIAAQDHGSKTLAAQLSYGDLISRTGQLLIDPGAAWVLYKLDGGLEHLLLDEVQDTAPAQWEIANALAGEFFAGQGARDAQRSIFSVGDPKQSIFSFQGADLRSFDAYREKFKAKAIGGGANWLDGKLSVSFRSTAPVLELTDAVFAEGFAQDGVCAPGKQLQHEVSRTGQAGRAILWPLTKPRDAASLPAWALPEDYESAQSSTALLAEQVADWVRARLGTPLPSRNREARPGDFLILVRRRDGLVTAITAALKSRGIEVAGLDRMVLTAQTGVSDLLALCDALLLPDDDLAFGQFLASPLGGLSDESLMDLALNRRTSLVAALYARAAERPDWAAAKAFFEALRAQADFLSPFALLSEALGPLGGRAKLLRRLGAEAAEPIDEFLAEALQFTQTEPGAMQNFVFQLRQSGASIKRESEAGSDEVRIMTVHGAKGLQAPVVILPDTTALPKADKKLFWLDVPQQGIQAPIFCPRSGLRASAVAQAAAADAAAAREEYNRLLYVALTRAEDEILICGAEGRRKPPETCWYEAVHSGFARLPTREENGVLIHESLQTAPPDRITPPSVAHTGAALPSWTGTAPDWRAAPPHKEMTKPERIVPSRGVDDEPRRVLASSPLGVERAASRAARALALEKGLAVHALLQHLPDLPPPARREAALRYLAAQPALAGSAASVAESVLSILNAPDLAPLFAPGAQAELPLAGVVGNVEIGGIVDRLAVTETEILLADYKTDRAPPTSPEGIPPKYIIQLAAYRAILQQIHPGRPVRCLLIWTETATAMNVPNPLLDAASPA